MVFMENNRFGYEVKFLNLPFNYKPVDKNWCIEKCISLGFTYKEPNINQNLTANMIPIDVYFHDQGLFDVLSELICKDSKYNLDIFRNTSKNLIKNKDIKKFINNDRWFKNDLKSHIEQKNPRFIKPLWELYIFAAAYYLDVCIYVFKDSQNIWVYFRKGWPKYKKVDMKNEKCIYLYMYERINYINVVTNVTGP
ncbi:uncharacterized protein LOC126908823 isoform X2 [Daktulosphaira vitifoliae]|nr:uncharacterized protein LOC126908823 isoform X2 [Daktulosphaira vitifoliae]